MKKTLFKIILRNLKSDSIEKENKNSRKDVTKDAKIIMIIINEENNLMSFEWSYYCIISKKKKQITSFNNKLIMIDVLFITALNIWSN